MNSNAIAVSVAHKLHASKKSLFYLAHSEKRIVYRIAHACKYIRISMYYVVVWCGYQIIYYSYTLQSMSLNEFHKISVFIAIQ